MATKTCKKCGWEVDRRSGLAVCPICKTKFDENVCKVCGAFCSGKDLVHLHYCRECYNETFDMVGILRRHRQRAARAKQEQFDKWIAKIKQVPADYPVLTEEQWIEACKYFNGCARCGAHEIDSRGYFIRYKDGGKYCDWNVLPLCEDCVQIAQTNEGLERFNPFRTYETDKIVKYLEPRLDAARGKK